MKDAQSIILINTLDTNYTTSTNSIMYLNYRLPFFCDEIKSSKVLTRNFVTRK